MTDKELDEMIMALAHRVNQDPALRLLFLAINDAWVARDETGENPLDTLLRLLEERLEKGR